MLFLRYLMREITDNARLGRKLYGQRVGRVKRAAGRPGGAGAFTLLELMAVMALLVLVLVLSVSGVIVAMENGRREDCRSNIRQLMIRVLVAASDEGGRLPPQFNNPDGVQGEWGNEEGGPGSGADWGPTRLFETSEGEPNTQVLRCRSDAYYYPCGGLSSASYKHWFNRPGTNARRATWDPSRSVIVSEHASNHGKHYSLLDEESVNYATLDGAVASAVASDIDYNDIHRWGSFANGMEDGLGALP